MIEATALTEAIVIRKATVEDAEAIHQAHMRSITEVCAKDYSPEEIAAWGGRPYEATKWQTAIANQLVWVIEENDEIVGFGHLRTFSEYNRRMAYIHGLYLVKSATGKGYGKALARVMMDEAKKLKVTALKLESTLTAKPFYERLGFESGGGQTTVTIGGQRVRCFPMSMNLNRS